MKIVFTNGELNPIWAGLAATVTYVYPETIVWYPEKIPPFRMYDDLHPDLLFCKTQYLSPNLVTVINKYKIPVILFGFGYPEEIKPLLLCYTGLFSHQEQVIKEIDIQNTHYIIKPAANIVQYNRGHHKTVYESDVFFHSNIPINETIMLILRKLTENGLSIKICGPSPVPLNEYLGQGNEKIISNLFSSTKLVLDYNNNSKFDAGFNNKLCITNIKDTHNSLYTVNDLIDCIQYLLSKNNKGIQELTQNNYNYCLQHTYFDRLFDMFEKAKEPLIAQKIRNKKEEFLANF